LTIGDAEPVPVVFDTGASGNVLDAGLATSLGLPNLGPVSVGSPAGGAPVEGFQTRIPQLWLGGMELRDVSAVALPVPMGRGVFGPNMFSGSLVSIDLGRGEIRISEKTASLIPPGEAYAYSDGPLPLPAAVVEIAGRRFDAHIDTGSNGDLSFPAEMASELPLDGPLQVVGRARLADGAERELMGARIQGSVRVGPVTLENPRVLFLDGLPRVNVGMGILRNLTVVLDPAERRGWILQ
jgi:predicted aspartyl protease